MQSSPEISIRVRKLRHWKKCRFCGIPRPKENKNSGWKFVPMLINNPREGGIACPSCYKEQTDLLEEAGLLIRIGV